MVLLKDNGDGIYITHDAAGKIVGNDPGNLVLGTLGTNYFYLDSIVQFKHTLNFGNQSDNMPGIRLNKTGNGTTGFTTGAGDLGGFTVSAIVSETVAEAIDEFGKRGNRTAASLIYLVRQTDSNVFRTFPNDQFAQKKFCPVVILTVDTTEVMEKGNDLLLATILLAEVWQ